MRSAETPIIQFAMQFSQSCSVAITRWLRAGNTVIDVMSWVSHANPETILRYAAKVKIRHAETCKKAESAFTEFANVGD
jgi:hypothetical protein